MRKNHADARRMRAIVRVVLEFMATAQLILMATFWPCAGLVLFSYGFYPALIWLAARVAGRPHMSAEIPDRDLPTVSILISAYKEESVIDERVRNVLALDYPQDKIVLVIASDGSSDRTAEIVRGYVG